jgi:L-amino acid N-acyltransferase YncA
MPVNTSPAVRIRRVEPTDEPAIRAFLERFCFQSRRTRFFSAGANMRGAAHWAASVDAKNHLGLLAVDASERVVGHAAYVRSDDTKAEVAVEVADDMHHLGIGTMLLLQLGRTAEKHGIKQFVADVLPDNHEMLAVFHDGFDPTQGPGEEVIKIAFPTSSWRLAESRFGQPVP